MNNNHISFWGRTLTEYEQMFNLEIKRGQKILSIADGPSTFNKEAHENGVIVDSVDPVYGLSVEMIRAYFNESYEYNKALFLNNRSTFVLKDEHEIDNLLQRRVRTFEAFLEDFQLHSARYTVGKLPLLANFSAGYDLCLCSNFLFLFGHLFDLDFHIASISELLRLGKEVRIFPLYDIEGKRSPYVVAVMDIFSETYDVTIEQVPYEVYKDGNKMMRIKYK